MTLQPTLYVQKPVPNVYFEEGRPTVVALCVLPGSEQEVLLVRPKKAYRHGSIFPQGGINRGESPLVAAVRELREEVCLSLRSFVSSEAVLLCDYPVVHDTDSGVKLLIPVYIPLRPGHKPRLPSPGKRFNEENASLFWCGGPNCLWDRIHECSDAKRRFMLACVRELTKKKLLRGHRWQAERLEPVMSFGLAPRLI
jgi:8-oxo-dGTP pyrophosphatase MutT (NUDIX family)